MSGYIKLYRSIQETDVLYEHHRYSKREAWLDLLLEAAWCDHCVMYGNRKIFVHRGDVIHSVRTLGKRWSWGIASVTRFLALLKTERMAEHRTERGIHIITIVNYNHYQGADEENGTLSGTESGTPAERQRNEHKKEKKENSISMAISPELENDAFSFFGGLVGATLKEWLMSNDEPTIRKAMAAAERSGIRTTKYVNGILAAWARGGGSPNGRTDRRDNKPNQTTARIAAESKSNFDGLD